MNLTDNLECLIICRLSPQNLVSDQALTLTIVIGHAGHRVGLLNMKKKCFEHLVQVCRVVSMCSFTSLEWDLHQLRPCFTLRRLRGEDFGPLLLASGGQTVAHAMSQVLRVQTEPRV